MINRSYTKHWIIPQKENESSIFPRLLTPSDTARNNYQRTPYNNPDPPVKITFFFQPRLKYPIRLIRFPLILGITFEELEFHSPTIPLSPVIRIDLYIWWPLISPSLICPPLAQPRRRHLWKTQIQLTSFDTFGSIRNNQSYIRLTFHQMQNIYMQFIKYSPFSH